MLLHPTLKSVSVSAITNSLYSHKINSELSYNGTSKIDQKEGIKTIYNNQCYFPIRAEKDAYLPIKGQSCKAYSDSKGNYKTKKDIEKVSGSLKWSLKSRNDEGRHARVYKISQKDAQRVIKFTPLTVVKTKKNNYYMVLYRFEKKCIVNRKFFKQPK